MELLYCNVLKKIPQTLLVCGEQIFEVTLDQCHTKQVFLGRSFCSKLGTNLKIDTERSLPQQKQASKRQKLAVKKEMRKKTVEINLENLSYCCSGFELTT